MKKSITILVCVIIFFAFITLNKLSAANDYVVTIIGKNGVIESSNTFDNYISALSNMNSYNSTNENVATMYKNNKIINSSLATATLLGSDNINLYTSTTTTSAYTYVNPAYGRDVAFIDYDETSNRAKIKISGFTGWTSLNNLEINPISSSSMSIEIIATDGINVRRDHTTKSDKLGAVIYGNIYKYYEKWQDSNYTWYKIFYNGNYGWIADDGSWTKELTNPGLKTYYKNIGGKLYHYYKYGSSSQSYIILGYSPKYLNENTIYYSFDGNYFYTKLDNMLKDYKNDNHSNSINKDNPYYAYYLYLPNHTKTGYTADDFNQVIISRGYNNKSESAMYGEGANFILSQEKYGVNALMTFSAAINESATGTSRIAKEKNNLFGHNAYDSCPYTCATTYASVSDSIMAHAKMTGSGYNNPSDWRYFGSHYGNKESGMNVKYASDPYWGEKAAANAFKNDNLFGGQDFDSNTIGVKNNLYNLEIKEQPDSNSKTIYTLKNNVFSVRNIPLIVTEKIMSNGKTWYKVYTDIGLDSNHNIITSGEYSFDLSYGYVDATYVYVENTEPSISASDKTVYINSDVSLLDGVSANDLEDGDITSRIQYTTNLDITSNGSYDITYTVSDNKRYETSKTIKINVIASIPIINYSDVTITERDTFNPLDGVTALDNKDGNITSMIQIISNNVNTNVPGSYEVKYSVTNSLSKTTTVTRHVTVLKKQEEIIEHEDITNLDKKNGEYYFDKLKIVDDKLVLSGYLTIEGINHNLNSNIKYKIKFTNEDGVSFEQDLDKITNESDMPFIIESTDNYNYKYAWFKGIIDISKLPNGNYDMEVIAYNNMYYSSHFVTNLFGHEMASNYHDSDKHVFIKSNNESSNRSVQLFIRNYEIGIKTANSRYNIYNAYSKIDYSIGGNYSINSNVKRKIVFENTKTFERYSFDNIGSIINGDYEVELVSSDGFDKTRAWYEARIDVSNIPKGEYAIYIYTGSNISDFGELQDKFYRRINTSFNLNNKNYSFTVDKNNRYRVIMIVK